MTRELTKKQLEEISEDDLGRRLLAALMSYHMGRSGVDYTLQRETRGVAKRIARAYGKLGYKLLERLIEREGAGAAVEGDLAHIKPLSRRIH